MQWYYADGDKQVGPVSEEELIQLVTAGKIASETLVWHEGMGDWAAYGSLSEQPAAPTQEQAFATATCSECGRAFGPDDVIQYQDATICAECKPAFFQRLQEGAPPVQGGGEGRTPNAEIMARARQLLTGNWGTAIGVCMVFWLISVAIGVAGSTIGSVVPFAGNIVQLLVLPPLTLGITMFFVSMANGAVLDFGLLFGGFKRYGTSIGAYFIRNLIVGACTGLAILPGIALMVVGALKEEPVWIAVAVIVMVPGIVVSIIVSYMFAMTFYILSEDETIRFMDAIKRSRVMMKGMKWKFFCLNMRFFGWSLLCMLTFFIGFIWLAPYVATSFAIFYHDVKGRLWIVQ